MDYLAKLKTAVLAAAFALVLLPSVGVEAKIISKKAEPEKRLAEVGSTYTPEYGSMNLAVKSGKKKATAKQVKKALTGNSADYFSWRTKAYFSDSKAYKTSAEYTEANSGAVKYLSRSSYNLCFLRSGTYTVTYDLYTKQDLEMKEDTQADTEQYYLYDNDESKKYSEEPFVKKTLNGVTYFEGVTSHQIYSKGSENWNSTDVVPAAIKKGADGELHLFYQPVNVIKTTHQIVYKIVKTTSPIASVKLGKAKSTRAVKANGYSTTTTVSRNQFLTGKKGRLTVKSSDKNFTVTSIIVRTYNKDGKPVYQKVKNKSMITYGTQRETSQYEYNSSISDYGYKDSSASMYKPTSVYIGYRNKFTGEFAAYDVITDAKTGEQKIKSTWRNAGATEDSEYTGSTFRGNSYSRYDFYKK
ncbi:MAG: hypothetical protein NC300_08815 [Bacteroidales bacterium]|nr:hypothetical protein [Clostridium sp.]MCM1204230.1 hypothetical protein [Bacteroidales bacterium]